MALALWPIIIITITSAAANICRLIPGSRMQASGMMIATTADKEQLHHHHWRAASHPQG